MVMETTKTAAVVLLTAIIIWMGSAVIRLERFHYATMLEVCPPMRTELDRARWLTCLESKKDLRTSPLYDLAHGLNLL